MFELKRLSKDAIPAALDKALRYRLLNEPAEAESICRDVLSIDPDNQQALVTLLLALTDRFDEGYAVGAIQAQEVLSRLRDEYERAYYAGIICERQAKARIFSNLANSCAGTHWTATNRAAAISAPNTKRRMVKHCATTKTTPTSPRGNTKAKARSRPALKSRLSMSR